jgi:hypothetical protein
MAERSLALLHDLAAEMLPAELVRSTTAYHWSLVLQLSSDYAAAVAGVRPRRAAQFGGLVEARIGAAKATWSNRRITNT